jgi:hypothetical protein
MIPPLALLNEDSFIYKGTWLEGLRLISIIPHIVAPTL